MKSPGFTLFELLLSMGISLILLAAAIPAYHHLAARTKTITAVNHITTAVHAARSAALAQNQVIAFCGSQDSLRCDGNWSQGQLMVIDQTQQILQIYAGLPAGDRLSWKSSLGDNNALKLAPTGFTDGQRGSFYYCPKQKPEDYGARIIVSESGRTRVEYGKQDLRKNCTS